MKNLNLKVNGVQHQFVVEEDMVLLDLLREELNLTGTKQGCDRKGQCGACTVIVNGKTVLSCLTKVANLDGAEVLTVEGLGTPDNPHLIQEAFVLSGAIQCGYCTPGMIMATKFLLDKNPAPDIQAIKKALTRTLCRCTGYTKIIDAVKLAGRFLRGETTPEKIRNSLNKKKLIGESHPRPSAMLKACGLAEFTADIKLNNALELAVVHSTEYHANIKSIDVAAAKKMPGVAGIMTAKDIKGTNHIPYSPPDQLVLCEDKVRTLGDPIAIVAAETRDQARAAAAAVKVEYERLPVMMTPAEALAPGAYQIHRHSPQNIQATQQLIKGDAGKALKEAKAIVEAEFSTQTNHQAPLEPEASVAYLEGEGKEAQLVVIGRSIDIHTHAGQIKEAVGWDNIRYKEAYVGGQFGIKLTITTEAIAAAAALHFKRPVRYIPSLTESMLISSKRGAYPSQKLKIAADASGHITAFCTDLVIDKGAYTLWGTACSMDRSFFMLSGAYNIPSIEAIGRTVFTNNASSDAARGAGPPESNFPLESIVDMLAEKMGIDPLEFRRMNSLKPGQSKATGTVVSQWPFVEVCDAMKPYYERAKREAQEFNAKGGKLKRGVGLGANAFGIGDGGDAATMTVEIDPDGGITIFAAVADPGEGNDSMLTQIAAHKLGLPLEKVRLYTRDTDKTVAMGPAAGSRMTLMAGNALLNAIENLQNAMKEAGVKTLAGLKAAGTPARYEGSASNPGPYGIDPKTGQGNSFTTDVQNLQMAEVEVNTETGETRVLKMTTVVDAGTVINPQAFEGQLEGGMDQGVGFALREEYVHGKTKDWITFKFPTIRDHFDIEIITLETPRSNGPLGAIGVGEMTMVSTAPAVINAIKDACGVRIYDLPATPEKVRAALAKHKE